LRDALGIPHSTVTLLAKFLGLSTSVYLSQVGVVYFSGLARCLSESAQKARPGPDMDKSRSGQALNAKDKTTHEQGMVSVLRTLHDELDAAVLAAYGWGCLGPVPWVEEAAPTALDLDAIAAHFKGKGRWRERLPVILETLVAIGRARSEDQSWWAA
jgi:hypothetical protein